jgi:transcriptional/translational regulatory protein YebC/TACO1
MAVEAGADDVLFGDDSIEIFAPVEAFKAINDVLRSADLHAEEAGVRMLPNNTVELPSDQTVQVMRLIETLEELDDTQQVFSTLHVSDEAVTLLETA